MEKMGCSVFLRTILLLAACLNYVNGQIEWINAMDRVDIPESPDSQDDSWKGVLVYTLRARRTDTGTSENIIYGFNNANDLRVTATSNFFRIDPDTGNVYTFGNKLDYEAGTPEVRISLIAITKDLTQWSKRTSTVRVTDLNDMVPVFANDSLTYEIPENKDVGTGFLALKNIYITDADTVITPPQRFLEAKIQYCIVATVQYDCYSQFELRLTEFSSKAYKGDFWILRPLDYENASKIQVQIEVTDGLHRITSDIVVQVQDLQDRPPIWKEKPEGTVKALDGTAPTQLVIKVRAEDQDTGKRPIFYSLKSGQTNAGIAIEDIFSLDQLTGIINNKVTLDLENTTYFRNYETKLIRNNWVILVDACEIIAEGPPRVVGTSALECANSLPITIQILDVNDNAPLLDRGLYVYSIYEDAPNGQNLDDPVIVINDKDTDLYNQFFTEFLFPSAEFEVGGANRTPVIRVKNTDLIDYDSGKIVYNLTLRTYDIDKPTLSSTAIIRINILDVNDNRPVFALPSYKATIPENSQEGVNVIRVQATDRDSGNFGTLGIQYELTGPYSNLFRIDRMTGQVTVAFCNNYGVDPCLDYDIPPSNFDLYVKATDDNGRGNAASVTLNVQLTDVNDNPPTVPDYEREIVENEREFTPELKVQGNDVDSKDLRYAITAQSPGNFWAIDPISGVIRVNKPNGQGIKFLDGDQLGTGGSSFSLNVRVTDGLYNANSKVKIIVIDINDNPPIFLPSRYEISINETTPGGTSILRITANDADDPTSANGQLQYSIVSGNVGGRFTLNKATGQLTVSPGALFDYDVIRRYTLIAVANDQGQPQLSGNATIIVNILDNNNKDPVIDPFLQEFTVLDNVPIGSVVGSVVAYDRDATAILRFAFTDVKEASSDEGYSVDPTDYEFRDLFTIVPETGRIVTNKLLDSRRTNIVSYGVIVKDIYPTPEQTGPGTVVINIKPFNTQPPRFDPYQSPLIIDEEQPIGSVIISLIAQDDNGIRLFELVEQPNSFFTINPTTGSVSIINRIDYDNELRINSSYFIARVTDTGDPELSATASVSVIFRNINDNFPEFVDKVTLRPVSIYTARIEENSPNGTPIATAFAIDNDRADNLTYNQIRYYMDDDRFDVDPITGQIFVRLQNGAVLDRETNPRINTRVIARDNPRGPADNQNQRAASVQITLTDVNDNPPQFSRDDYYVQIFETIGVGTEILQLFSSDRDIGDNAVSFYSKIIGVGTDYNDYFDVRREAGRIYVKNSLVRHVGTYKFYVQAQDKLGTGFTANASVTVDVLPSANSPPIWVIPPIDNMTIYVLEEQYNGMLIYDVSARDEDTGRNGIVDYSFIYEGETTQATPEFKINKVTGVIQAEIVYDREKVDRYVLLLKATDRGETPLETTRFLTVIILDVNDNAPTFADREVQIDVTESQPLGDIKAIPKATDPDLNPVIVYDIISGNEDGVFGLDRNTGMLQLRKPLDRESRGIYYIDVQASNDEPDYTVVRSRRRRAIDPSIITLKIVVGDINDLAPVFLSDRYYGCISTRAPYDKHILTVQAVDRDAVGTGIVRYRLTAGHILNNQSLFDIHQKFGVVTNKLLMRSFAGSTFSLTVEARDAEDLAMAEAADTVAQIFVYEPNNEVRLLITQNTAEVRLYQSQLQSIIEGANDLDYVCINEIQDHVIDTVGSVTTLWSDVYVTGIRKEVVNGQPRNVILSSTELSNIINRERATRKSDFDLLYIKTVEAASSTTEVELRDEAVLIIMIIIVVLVFLVIVFCIIAFLCIRAAKRQKKALLLHKTHATPLMAPEPVVVEPVIYDNRAYIQEEPPVRVQEERVVEHDPVHVQYAVVQKKPQPQYEQREYVTEDDQDAIVVELKDDEPRNYTYEPEHEYRIETEVVRDNERF